MSTDYSKERLEDIIKESRSFRDMTIRMGLAPHGVTIYLLKQKVMSYCHSQTSNFRFKGRKHGGVTRAAPGALLKSDGT